MDRAWYISPWGFRASGSTQSVDLLSPVYQKPPSSPSSTGLHFCFIKRMIEEGNPPNTHTEVESTHSNVGVGSLSQSTTVVKVYATTAEAIAIFKPTHREVISGIAPHVFDERKKRRSQRRASSPSRPYWCDEPVAEKRPSPLRGTSVCAWEVEHSIYQPAASSKHPCLIPCLKFKWIFF